MAEPITGTTLLMANLIDLSPRASARDATAVFIESTDTNAAAQTETSEVIQRFKVPVNLPIFSSLFNDEHIPRARKQFISGMNILDAVNESPWASISSIELVENDVVTPPEAATMAQKTGINANIKSAATAIAVAEEDIQGVIFVTITTAIISAEAVEYTSDSDESIPVLKL